MRIIAACLVGTMAAACAATPSKPPDHDDAGARSPLRLELWTTEQCPLTRAKSTESALGLSPLALGFVANLGGKLVAAAIEKLANYLGTDQVFTLTTTRAVDAFAQTTTDGAIVAPALGCIVVAVAPSAYFARQPAKSEDVNEVVDADARTALSAWYTEQHTARNPQNAPDIDSFYRLTHLRKAPSFYSEMTVRLNPIKKYPPSAIAIDPKAIYLKSFLGPTSWRLKGARDILFTVELRVPGQETPFARLSIKRDAVENADIDPASIENQKQGWSALPSDVVRPPTGAPAMVLFSPVNITASFVETAHPHTLAKAMADVLREQKDDISKAATAQANILLSRDAALLARQTAINSQRDAINAAHDKREAYEAADAAVRAAQERLDAASKTERPSIQAELAELAKLRNLAREEATATREAAGLGDLPPIPTDN